MIEHYSHYSRTSTPRSKSQNCTYENKNFEGCNNEIVAKLWNLDPEKKE